MNRRIQNRNGWGLVETLLTLGAISAMSAAIYVALGPTSAAAQVKVEQDNLHHLSRTVDRSFGLLGNFSSVSTSRVLDDGLAPTRMRDGTHLRTAWGTGVGLYPYAINTPNDSFLVSYSQTPAEVCARLASAMARDAYDIRVEGRSVYAGGSLDPAIAAEQCGQADTAGMEFVFHSGLVSGQAVAAPPLVLPPAPPSVAVPPSAPVTIVVPGAPDVDPAQPGAPVLPPSAPPPVVLPPSAPTPGAPAVITPPLVSPPVAPPPVSPPGVVCSPPATWTTPPQTRTLACPSGQVGAITQARTGTHSYTCPEAWESPVESLTWSGWATTGDTCASCPAPETRTRACPAGQLGAITDRRSFVCSGSGSWGGWTQIASTCAAACVLPSPSTQSQAQTRTGKRTLGCPAGQVGAITQTRPERRTQSRTAFCPAATGAWSWGGWSAWSGWAATGSWSTTGNTCKASDAQCSINFSVSYSGNAYAGACYLNYSRTCSDGASDNKSAWTTAPKNQVVAWGTPTTGGIYQCDASDHGFSFILRKLKSEGVDPTGPHSW